MAPFTLQQILSRAVAHPVYFELVKADSSQAAVSNQPRGSSHSSSAHDSKSPSASALDITNFPLLTKPHLTKTFQHLIATDPHFLRRAYVSPTGGTRTGNLDQLYYISDISENFTHRLDYVQKLAKPLGIFSEGDITVNLHGGIGLVRNLELTSFIIENSGATDIPIGVFVEDPSVYEAIQHFRATVISGASSRILQFARWLHGSYPGGPSQHGLKIKKIVYTSEPLLLHQEAYLHKVLGVEQIGVIYGSAEAGPCAGTPPTRVHTGLVDSTCEKPKDDHGLSYRDFVIHNSLVVIEIIDDCGNVISSSLTQSQLQLPSHVSSPQIGEIVITSLSRLRNPLVRYRTGDQGSLYRFEYSPSWFEVSPDLQPEEYSILRLYGRHGNESFFVDGDYIDIAELNNRVFSLSRPGYPDVLEWQVIITHGELETSKEKGKETVMAPTDQLEFRVVITESISTAGEGKSSVDVGSMLVEQIRTQVIGRNIGIHVKIVDYEGLERGRLARKVRKVVDLR